MAEYSYNQEAQEKKLKGAFAQVQKTTWNTLPDIDFVSGITPEKLRSLTQGGTTPKVASGGKTWNERKGK